MTKRSTALSHDTITLELQDMSTLEAVEAEAMEEYKNLNEKCDKVIVKIKSRKAKKSKNKP